MNGFQTWYRAQPPALRAVLTINVVVYVLWALVLVHVRPAGVFVWRHLALDPALPGLLFQPWQLVTYNFLHLGVGFWGLLHILFNMLWLVWIGREYEQMQGSHRFLAIYLLTGVGGGLLTVMWYVLFPSPAVVYGASASVLGVITAVAVFYPYKSIALMFIGTVRLVYVVIGFLVLDLLLISGSSTAVTAHMGGALFGFLFARGERAGLDLSSWALVFFGGRGERRPARRPGPSARQRAGSFFASRKAPEEEKPAPRSARITPMRVREQKPDEPAADGDVDRILDKISEQGYEALTAEEKRLLYEASKK